MIPLVIIAGPTASGKTSLAIEVAKMINGEIISADSMQIYKKMNIGSAKPTVEEMDGVVHHLFDVCEPSESFSLSDYCTLAHKAIKDVYSRGKIPILAGGTGLYIDTVCENIELSDAQGGSDVREALQRELSEKGAEHLYKKLQEIDLESAKKLHVNDTKRVIRALEIFYLSGKTKTEADKNSKKNKKIYDYLYFAIEIDREKLYNRINIRVDNMMKQGLLDEVRSLCGVIDVQKSTAMYGIGYREVLWYFKGLITKCEMISLIKRNTRRLAKRQMTWFRKNKEIKWIAPDDARYIADKVNERWKNNA